MALPLRKPSELKEEEIRWRPEKGEPTCVIEWVLQHTWLLVPYIAIIVTAMLILMVMGH